jgi:hypothetical protein
MNSGDERTGWANTLRLIEDPEGHPSFARRRTILLPIVKRAIEAQFDLLFEADLYFDHLRFYPTGRSKTGSRVTVELRAPAYPMLYISLSNCDIQYQSPQQFTGVLPEQAFPVLTRYLQHLWEENVPEPIPEILRRKENYVP